MKGKIISKAPITMKGKIISKAPLTMEDKMVFPINPKQRKAKSQEQSGESCSLWGNKRAGVNGREKMIAERISEEALFSIFQDISDGNADVDVDDLGLEHNGNADVDDLGLEHNDKDDVDDLDLEHNDKALKLFLFWSNMIDAVCGLEHNFSLESKQRK